MLAVTGMSQARQCENPLPVGASGSNISTAKLLVAAGAPDHARRGVVSGPAHTSAAGNQPPSVRSGEPTRKCATDFCTPLRIGLYPNLSHTAAYAVTAPAAKMAAVATPATVIFVFLFMGHEFRANGATQEVSSHPGTARTTRQSALAEFLVAMRGRLTPDDVGLRSTGRRRTPGLRRQEVAELAAVSIDWYIRLEQGRVGAPAPAFLDAIAAALRLSPAEREYLHPAARGEAPPRRSYPARAPRCPRSLRGVLDGMPLLPAYVHRPLLRTPGRQRRRPSAMFGASFGTGTAAPNVARLLFLDPEARRTQLSWEQIARETVGALRANLAPLPTRRAPP